MKLSMSNWESTKTVVVFLRRQPIAALSLQVVVKHVLTLNDIDLVSLLLRLASQVSPSKMIDVQCVVLDEEVNRSVVNHSISDFVRLFQFSHTPCDSRKQFLRCRTWPRKNDPDEKVNTSLSCLQEHITAYSFRLL